MPREETDTKQSHNFVQTPSKQKRNALDFYEIFAVSETKTKTKTDGAYEKWYPARGGGNVIKPKRNFTRGRKKLTIGYARDNFRRVFDRWISRFAVWCEITTG